MTGTQLAEIASEAYTELGRDGEEIAMERLHTALSAFGVPTDILKMVARRLTTYKGVCWLGAAPTHFSDPELLDELKSTCVQRPPSKWPELDCKD